MNSRLTRTEDTVVKLMMIGFQRKEIANKMNRSLDTVSVHFRNIHLKTESQNVIELYNWYVENVLQINIRKMLQVGFLLLILSPSIFTHCNDIQRARRTKTTRTSRASRRGESDTDFYLLN